MPRRDRRTFIKQAGATLAATAVTSTASSASVLTRPQKNVLFFAVDDLRTSLGCFGDRYAITPNIDALARQGTLFTRAYCQQAVCSPSRQSLLTGLRPDSIKVWDLKTHFRHTSPGVVSLPEHFKNNGYFTQSIGKIFHGEPPMADPPSWSVPETFEYTPKRDDYILEKNHTERTAQKADVDEFVDDTDDAYPDGKVAAAAVDALSKLSKEKSPFFLAVGMRKPHLPFTAPKRYWEMFEGRPVPPIQRKDPPEGAPELALHDSTELRGYIGIPAKGVIPDEEVQRLRRGYYAAMTYTDAQIGRVLRALEKDGLHRNTDIVLWADHGFHLGEHGLWCKTTNYESDTHVPLIFVDADRRGQTARCEAVVELLDIFPTLCDMCRLPKPEGLEGKSLIPWLENAAYPSASTALSQFPRPWFYREQPEYMGYSVRTKSYRYVEWRRFETGAIEFRELYDMRLEEGFERSNLASDPTQRDLIESLSLQLPKGKSHRSQRNT